VIFIKGGIVINNRQSFRLRKQFDVTWSIPEHREEGQGIISNISLSGMLFVTDRLFEVEDNLNMCFTVTQSPSFPSKGKLVWFRKVGKKRSQYQCGVRFAGEYTQSPAWVTWMEGNISQLADTENSPILGRILGAGE
jgi:hypothetical protein